MAQVRGFTPKNTHKIINNNQQTTTTTTTTTRTPDKQHKSTQAYDKNNYFV
jgi:hypothetical protein